MLKAYIDTGGSEKVGKLNSSFQKWEFWWATWLAQVILQKYKDPHIYTAVIK